VSARIWECSECVQSEEVTGGEGSTHHAGAFIFGTMEGEVYYPTMSRTDC
jgi:hypothetical protein